MTIFIGVKLKKIMCDQMDSVSYKIYMFSSHRNNHETFVYDQINKTKRHQQNK